MIDTNFNVTPVTTGTMGLLGNLWAGEIQEQLIHAQMQKASRGWMRKLVFLGSDKPLNRLEQFLQSKAGRINAALFGLVLFELMRLCLLSIFVQQVHICRARVIQSPFAMSSSWEWESLARICCKTEGCCDACIEHCAGRAS